MQENDFDSSPLSNSQPLRSIKGIKFTQREIDIIACLLQGRTQKTIASFLSIAPRTVETHTRNIMLKLECNSKEAIIDYVESAGRSSALRNHYQSLLTQREFEKQLQTLAARIKGKDYACRLLYEQGQENKVAIIQKLEEDLKKVGIMTFIEKADESKLTFEPFLNEKTLEKQIILYVASKDSAASLVNLYKGSMKSNKLDLLILLWEQESPLEALPAVQGINYINLFENYYLSFLKIIKIILPEVSIDVLISSFKQKYELLQAGYSQIGLEKEVSRSTVVEPPLSTEGKGTLSDSKQYSLLANVLTIVASVLTIIILVLGVISFKGTQENNTKEHPSTLSKSQIIHSDLFVPKDSASLPRPLLLAQIDKALKEQQGIQTVALVGIGGAGKTTLARQYARQRKGVAWEINAETERSLISSLESLAYALSQTEKEKSILNGLQEIKDFKIRTEKIISFVKEKLKKHPNWFLIFDNVETLTDIQKYFPSDLEVWGKGTIIVTTRDANIQSNSLIQQTLNVEELDQREKLCLFLKITSQGRSLTTERQEQLRKFLEKIPPFPLDVSIAAYYLKITNTPYEKYLEHLKEYNKDFEMVQEEVLKEASDYTKTRYSVIALSLNQLINAHTSFKELLLFISLLDSQNIPRDLLSAYKGDIVADDFIYHLKKYSLLTNKSSELFYSSQTLSIHRSTQAISLAYLMKELKLRKNAHFLEEISNTLADYMADCRSREDHPRMKLLARHCEEFLIHRDLLTGPIIETIYGELGCILCCLGNYTQSKQLLEESLRKLSQHISTNYIRITPVLVHLGVVNRELGNYKKAKELLEQGLLIYKKHFSENYNEIFKTLAYLGITHWSIGNYKKSRDLLEQALIIHKKFLPENLSGIAWVHTCLGVAYWKLGEYEKARTAINYSLSILKKHFPESHDNIARAYGCLGLVYWSLGEYEKAKDLLEQGRLIYQENFSEDHIGVSWILAFLGNIYRELGQYEKAKGLLEESLTIHEKYFPKNHARVALTLAFLGNNCLSLGQYEKAKGLLEESLMIYKEFYGTDHIEVAKILRDIGEFYFLKNELSTAEQFMSKALKIYQQNKHPESYISLESLAELYIKKAVQAQNKGDRQLAVDFQKQSLCYLNQALEIVRVYLPQDSPHITRVKSKIQKYGVIKQ